MLRELRGLARETAVYGLSTVLGRLLNFLLVPLYSHLLEPSANGVQQTLYAYVAFLNAVYWLGLDTAYLRLGRREGGSDPAAFGTAFATVTGWAFCASAALHLLAEPVTRLLGIPAELADVVRFAAWILFADAATQVPFAELRASHRAGLFASLKLAGIALNITLAIVLVSQLKLGLRGVFLANLAASAATLAALAPVIISRLEAPDKGRLRELLAFGLPLALATLGSLVVGVADRPILSKTAGFAAAGIYGTCYKLGIAMALLVGMFDQAWKPFILQRAGRDDAPLLVARVLTYFALLASWAFLAIAFFVPALAAAPLFGGRPLIHEAYWAGLAVVPIVSLGYLFNGLYFVMLAPLMLAKRTTAVTAATWLGAAVNLGANFVLIPRMGFMGAAWATLAAYAAMAAAVWALGRRPAPAPYETGRLLLVAAWTGALWFLGSRLGLAGRLVVLAAFPLALRVSGFLAEDERAELSALLRRKPA